MRPGWMPRHKATFQWRKLGMYVALLAAVSACGSGSGQSATQRRRPTSRSTSTTTTTTAPITARLGQVALSVAQLEALCPGAQPQTQGEHILPGALLAWQTDCAGGPTILVVDLRTGGLLWRRPIQPDENVQVGTDHIFVVSTQNVPASALATAYPERVITALNAKDGTSAWTGPFEDWIPQQKRNTDTSTLEVDEGPSGDASHPNYAVAALDGTTVFDADSGAVIAQNPQRYDTQASGSYAGYGTILIYGLQDNDYTDHRTGLDARNGAQIWDLHLPESSRFDQVRQDVIDDAGNMWEFGGQGFYAYSLRTGQAAAQGTYPAGWDHVAGSPAGVAGWNSTTQQLSFVTPQNPGTPVWTISAEDTSPELVTPDLVVVEGPRGLVMLDTKSGHTVNELTGVNLPSNPTEVAGFVVAADGSVIQVANS